MNGILYLEDGTCYHGKGFGKQGTSVGELVFNTSMTGYQEILTDPSYADQVITMTYPLIGNYGTNSAENESPISMAKGLIVKEISQNPSNYMCEASIASTLKSMNVVGIYDVDTRSITKKIRSLGSTKCIISNEIFDIDELKELLDVSELRPDLMVKASTRERVHHKGDGHRVALIDYGVKNNIVNILKGYGCDVMIFPYTTSAEEIMAYNPDGILLSNGPGDPKSAVHGIDVAKSLLDHYPIFGICMGHQILSIALGGDTFKMKYGHRGGNHGVYDVQMDKAYITSQNHGYAVLPSSLEDKDIIITHKNLNDDSIEGISHKHLPLFSVQFHPEGSPGPEDSRYLFDKFIKNMEVRAHASR